MALFVEVVKAKGFRNAAEVIGIPNSTLSRRISNLEKAIGLRLLNRTTRKIELTEAGQIYFDRCRRILTEATLAHEELNGILSQPSGLLRISLPVDFGSIFLTPLLVKFTQLYPEIKFEIDLSPQLTDLVSRNIDVAIRVGNQADSNLIAHKLMQFQGQLFASATYLQKFGIPTHPQELIEHECLTFSNNKIWKLHENKNTVSVKVSGKFSLNNIGMLRKLSLLNQGVLMIPPEVVIDDIKEGALIPILPQWKGDVTPIYALTETKLIPAKTRTFINFLKSELAGYQYVSQKI